MFRSKKQMKVRKKMSKERIGVGVIGCGNISLIYIPNLVRHYKTVEVIAVADIRREAAEAAAEKNGIARVLTIDELLADPDIELVINLTIPAVHFEINKKILEAGKHAYCEKPLAMTLEEADELVRIAEEKGLYVTSAPDTFLGSALQTCRKLIDDGAIGRVTGFTANLCQHGSELWHPSPKFLYMKGAGPMMDMGPYYITALVSLLGPIKQIIARCSCPTPKRPIKGELFDVEVPTSYNGIIEFANGAVGNIFTSYDVWQSQLPHIELYGDDGVIYGTDPNMFSGQVRMYDGRALEKHVNEDCEGFMDKLMAMHGPDRLQFLKDVPSAFPEDPDPMLNMRGLGAADLAGALISARSDNVDRIVGLEVGADDYLSKPVSPREVVIRIKKAIKKNDRRTELKKFSLAELTVFPDSYQVFINDKEINLTSKEVEMLTFLISNSGKVLTREHILNAVWGYEYCGDTRAVDTMIKRLRQKLMSDDLHFIIRSVYGVGYIMEEKR